MSWSTKATGGFREGHIKVLNDSLPSLSALICCFVKDLVVTSLIERLEDEIQEQTMELAAANSCLGKANKRIMQQAESQLRNFAMMSHEIRTPLNCIIGMSNLLLHSDLDEDVKESIEMITSSGDLLLAVVDDVLDYSKLATGKVETRIEMTQITQVIRTVVASVQIRAKITGVDLETHLAATLPSGVETDGRRLQQILYNLLGNAIKFGREGRRVEFDVELVRRGSLEVVRDIATGNAARTDDDLIRFSIKDYGKGVQPSDIEKIFQPFQQAATHDPTVGGTGLGLAITNQLVRVLGGTISVESVYGSWCKFVVLLPVTSDRPIVPLRKDGTDTESVALLDQCQFSYHSSRTISVSSQPRDHSAKTIEDDDSWSDDDSYSSLSTSTPTNSHSRSTSSKYLGEPIIHAKDHGFFSSVQMELSTPRLLPVEKPHEEENVTSKSCEMQSKTFSLNEVQDLLEQSRRHSPLTVTPTEEKLAPRALVALSDYDVREHSIAFAELRVLIAEDNKINQKVLNQTLMRMGLRDIDIVDDGKKAVEAFDTKEYDVIFMDLQMPVMDGLEATIIISSKKRARGIEYPKVAFLTAHAMVDYQDRAAAAGGDGFVSKPYKYDVLKELVIRFMESRQR
jgi:signal transduction histidine kinase